MVARRRGNPFGVRKVRAPQRRVAGNARPPRGEDQRHSDDAGAGALGPRRRSETRQALPGARPNRRAQPGLPGERRAAQPSGRLHEPAGNCRPQMDGHPRRRFGDDGTELGLQVASLAHPMAVGIVGPRRLAGAGAPVSPRRVGRCGRPCRRCRPPLPHRDRRSGPEPFDPETGTRRHRSARRGCRPGSACGTCSGGSGEGRADTDRCRMRRSEGAMPRLARLAFKMSWLRRVRSRTEA